MSLGKIKDFEFREKVMFVEIDTVNEYSSLSEFKENNSVKYDNWRDVLHDTFPNYSDDDYCGRHSYSYTVSKIASITLGFYYENEYKTHSIVGDEVSILKEFVNMINRSAKKYPNLCGFNLNTYTLPFIFKRFAVNRSSMLTPKQEPLFFPESIIRQSDAKPWEKTFIDIGDAWSFSSKYNSNPKTISILLGIGDPDLLTEKDLRTHYYNNDEDLIKENGMKKLKNSIGLASFLKMM